ncbi:MAG: methylmalonyl Co-A mutase-associated GTPase MeaB [Acidobacteriota bacterium]|nr:methylmalonyl Co-A mutase-associated GTPase MeaB [Acidobacteriota bacterium]
MFPPSELIRRRDHRALGKAATAVERGDPAVLPFLREYPGAGLILGITGPPGAGKSTLVDALARHLRGLGKTVAVIAVDPSSRATGGALLGDRIRMQRHHADSGIFIRSMATRGVPGGIAQTTSQMARLFRAADFDYIIIETVGVGQDEIAIASLADVTVVVLVPGMGDDVQAIKAGIMEVADVFVINKADHPGADRTEREIQSMLTLAHGPNPEIVRTVATEGAGIAELIAAAARVRPQPKQDQRRFRIDHLGIAVRSLAEASRFYEQLGLHVSSRETVAAERVHAAMLPVGESRIELLEASDQESTIAKFIGKRGEGLHHVALRVPDLLAAVEALRNAGARILNEPRRGAGGHLYVFIHPAGTGGVLWELIQE